MANYIYKRNKDGIHYIDIQKTWEKASIAARIIAATQAKNPKDVLVSSNSLSLFHYCCCPSIAFQQMTSLLLL
jgi:ribosomal protein S2